MTRHSPGLSYLATTLLPAALSRVAIATALFGIVRGIPIIADGRLIAVICGVSVIFGPGAWKWLKIRVKIRRLHTEPPPKLQGYLPGNLDIFVGFLWNFKDHYPGELLAKAKAQHGSIVNIGFLWDDMIFTDCPEIIKQILVSDFPNYVKGETFRDALHSVLGAGIFNSDGDIWKFHRSIARPFFAKTRIRDFEIFERNTSLALDKMLDKCCGGTALDFQDLATRFTLDTAAEFLFGTRVSSISSLDAPSDSTMFAQAFGNVLRRVVHRIRWTTSGWQLLELFGDRTKRDMRIIHGFIDPIVEEAISNAKVQRLDGGEEQGTLLSHLVTVTDDKQLIRDEILNTLLAGRDTTAVTLSCVVYFLAMHRPVFKKLRVEVLSSLGPTYPTYDNIKDMQYLRAVINETLRLLPPVPLNLKETVHDTVWTHPMTGKQYFIPEQTKVMYSVLSMHRDTTLWGPDALEFDPSRWLDDRKQHHLNNPFIFLPFQAGPRICIGQQFALNVISYFTVRLLQRFEDISLGVDAAPPDSRPPPSWRSRPWPGTRKNIEEIKLKSHLTLYIDGGLWIRAVPTRFSEDLISEGREAAGPEKLEAAEDWTTPRDGNSALPLGI